MGSTANKPQTLFEASVFLWHLNTANYNLDFILPPREKSCPGSELKIATLASIGERFPLMDWLHVYMDGSAVGAD
ncbi:hypothetical protein TNIN_50891 [Trichonephila inaurata madagascariensis]|uniref:Uncharacterized protein n=1 Tax=Trichonephila inaurata madagascariensis TaxID=2747483 RepID=A0A8X6MM69_9ARAC|nr:hypothetical protein TNIN_50891 [Trichonephila inaurata madagascariensis]